MKCDCCGQSWEIMYRTIDTLVYCLDCSRRTSVCCYGKPVRKSWWFRVSMSERQLDSLEERGYARKFEESDLNPLTVKRYREDNKAPSPPKYKAKAALNFGRKRKGKK